MIKRSWEKKKNLYPGKHNICKICGLPKEWKLQTAHDQVAYCVEFMYCIEFMYCVEFMYYVEFMYCEEFMYCD